MSVPMCVISMFSNSFTLNSPLLRHSSEHEDGGGLTSLFRWVLTAGSAHAFLQELGWHGVGQLYPKAATHRGFDSAWCQRSHCFELSSCPRLVWKLVTLHTDFCNIHRNKKYTEAKEMRIWSTLADICIKKTKTKQKSLMECSLGKLVFEEGNSTGVMKVREQEREFWQETETKFGNHSWAHRVMNGSTIVSQGEFL